MRLEGTRTEAALRQGLQHEAETAMRLLYLARRADVEGRPDLALALRAAAEGEMAHAFGHLEFLEEVDGSDTTGDAIGLLAEAAETASDSTYGDAGDVARREGLEEIADWLGTVADAEVLHADYLRRAVARIREVSS